MHVLFLQHRLPAFEKKKHLHYHNYALMFLMYSRLIHIVFDQSSLIFMYFIEM